MGSQHERFQHCLVAAPLRHHPPGHRGLGVLRCEHQVQLGGGAGHTHLEVGAAGRHKAH